MTTQPMRAAISASSKQSHNRVSELVRRRATTEVPRKSGAVGAEGFFYLATAAVLLGAQATPRRAVSSSAAGNE